MSQTGDWWGQSHPPAIAEEHGSSHSPATGTDKIHLLTAAYFGAPVAVDDNRIVTSANLTNHSYTIAAQPDVPRNITIDVTDTTPSLTAGLVTVTGTDPSGEAVSEVLDLADALTFVGTKIFASVTTAVASGLIAEDLDGAGDETIIVGVGAVIGLPSPIADVAAVKHVYFNAARVASPTITAGAQTSGVDGGTLDGSKTLLVIYDVGG